MFTAAETSGASSDSRYLRLGGVLKASQLATSLHSRPGHLVIALCEPKESRGSVKIDNSLNQQIWCPTEWICTTAGLSLWTSLLLTTDFSPFLLRQAGFWFIPTASLCNCSHKWSHTRQLPVPVWQGSAWSRLLCPCSMYVHLALQTQYWQEWRKSKFRLKIYPFTPAPSQSRSDRWHLRRRKRRGQGVFLWAWNDERRIAKDDE